jgi:hypothetical protein
MRGVSVTKIGKNSMMLGEQKDFGSEICVDLAE